MFLRLYQGRIQSGSSKAGDIWLAAGVNGVIRGTARTFPVDSSNHGFAIMVPEESFHSGKNSIQIFILK